MNNDVMRLKMAKRQIKDQEVEICDKCSAINMPLSFDNLCIDCELEYRYRLVINNVPSGRFRDVIDATKKAFVVSNAKNCRIIKIYPATISLTQYLAKYETVTSSQLIAHGMSKQNATNTLKKAADDGLITPCGHGDVLRYIRRGTTLKIITVKDKLIKYTLKERVMSE
jgi:predicted nucleic-acid-binding Zn-ribbon protein